MKNKEKSLVSKIIINFILACIFYVGILIYFDIFLDSKSFDFVLTMLHLFIFYFLYKTDVVIDKKTKKYSWLISVLLAIMLVLGSMVKPYIYTSDVTNIFGIKKIIFLLIGIAGFAIILSRVFNIILPKIATVSIVEKHNKMTKKQFIGMFLLILFGYSLYFIRYYPACMSTDSYYVLHYANNFILSDFHSFGHTWFVGIFFHLGKFLFHNMNMAVGLATFVQMSCMALIFAGGIRYFYNKGVKKSICIAMLLFYALSPLHAYYSITLWRDIMFGGAFVILLICLYEFMSSKEKISKSYIVLFIVASLIILFFRNNGIYIFIFLVPFLIILLKGKRKLMSILSVSLLCFYVVIKGPVFDYFNVAGSKTVESFSIPLQQMARVVALDDDNINSENKEYLEQLFDYDKVKTSYKPYISDDVKGLTNGNVIAEDYGKFISTWGNMLVRHPNTYVEAYLLQTLGYWYPNVEYWATRGESSGIFESEDVYTTPLTPSWYNKIFSLITSRKIPLSMFIWSVAIPFIVLLISSMLLMYFNKKKYLLCYVPLFGLWLSIMVASPVFCELRYVYGLFTCLLFMLVIPLLLNSKKEKKNSKGSDKFD